MRIQNAVDIGLIIRDRRRSLGLDQQSLAERVGVSRQWIIAIEKGKPRAEVGLVFRTLQALGLHLSVEADERKLQAPRGSEILDFDLNDIIDKARGSGR